MLPVPHGSSQYVGMLHHDDYGDEPVKVTLTVRNKTDSPVWEYAGQWAVMEYDRTHLSMVPLQAEDVKISTSGSGKAQRIMIQNTAGVVTTFLDGKVDAGSGRLYGSLTQDGVKGGAFELHPVPQADLPSPSPLPPQDHATPPQTSVKASTSIEVNADADTPLQESDVGPANATDLVTASGSLTVSVGMDGHVHALPTDSIAEADLLMESKLPPAQAPQAQQPRKKWLQLQQRRERLLFQAEMARQKQLRLEAHKAKLANQSAAAIRKEVDDVISSAEEETLLEQKARSVRLEGTVQSEVPAQTARTVRAEATVVTV